MSKYIIVKVTASDIRNGQRDRKNKRRAKKMKACAIERALIRKFKASSAAWGFTAGSVYKDDESVLSVDTFYADEEKVHSFVNDHDDLKRVKPFQFRAELRGE